ncbi:MAG: penicillin-binding protein 2 [Deltaproteobacteria bacterium]|nr:penicillin-binding protein 2 [Deltaproteobacteria bacterium]
MITAPLATPKTEDRELNRRLRLMAWLCTLAFVVLAGRLWQLQVLRGELYLRKSADNFVKDIEIPALRGQVRDHKGRVLGDNRAAYNVYVTPRFLTPEALERLCGYLNLSAEQATAIKTRAKETRGLARFRAQLAVEDVSREQMALVATNRQNLPGVQIEAVPRRTYPLGTSAAHVLGYINEISAAELNSRREQGYRSGDLIGRTGLERQWEGYLRGTPGFERVVVDAKGQRKSADETRELLQTPRRQDPVPGNNIVLTLDADLQRLAERAFRRYPAGAAVVVDVETGRLLALVSKPGFDPNLLSGRLTFAEEARLNQDPYRPRLDKTLREHYYPGSTFKVVPAVAALEEGVISPDERVQCKGYHELGRRWFRCSKFHGRVNMYEALAQSCNIYFYKLGERVGMDRIARYAREFGLGEPTGLGLNGEVPGFIPTQAWYREHAPGGFRLGYTLNATIGQGATKVTVLQLAMLYAAIANGGSLNLPQLVERIDTAANAPVQEFPPRLRRRVAVKPVHLETLQRALAGTTHQKGTAYDARLKDIEVSGKTGTAQVRKMGKVRSEGREQFGMGDHAWFVGFAPTRRPQIAVVVLVEHGGLGGHVAAPVAMEIMRGYFEQVAPERRVSRRGADEPGRAADARPLTDLPAPQLKDLGPSPARAGVGGGH